MIPSPIGSGVLMDGYISLVHSTLLVGPLFMPVRDLQHSRLQSSLERGLDFKRAKRQRPITFPLPFWVQLCSGLAGSASMPGAHSRPIPLLSVHLLRPIQPPPPPP